jgi:Ca2+-transporting ATPase
MLNQSQYSKIVWHNFSIQEAIQATNGNLKLGLTDAEVRSRQQEFGLNTLKESKRRTPLKMVFDQFKDFMVLVLVGSALISGFLGEAEDTVAIVFIVMMNAVLGFMQEYRSEKAMEALKALTLTKAKVLRSGAVKVINADQLVPGDQVFLEAGDLIPADLRITESQQLRVDEARLTGESLPVEKCSLTLSGDNLSLGDRHNMLHKGTLITYGRGTGLVVATGMQTEIGKIASILHSAGDTQTPLQKRLSRFGKRISIFIIGLCFLIFIFGIFRGEKPVLMFLTALSLAVAAIPEALPAVVTVLLALGARRMISKNALIKRLPAVETLGSVTFICSDKTGTLTQNRMQVSESYCGPSLHLQDSHAELFFRAIALNNDAYRNEQGEVIGDPTEKALLEFAEGNSFIKALEERHWPRIAEIPFSSERSMMSTLHRNPKNSIYIFIKGAPEQVLAQCCTQFDSNDKLVSIETKALTEKAETMAKDGLRVLAVACKSLALLPAPTELKAQIIEKELTFLGFVGLIDPPREEAKQAIQDCQNASIKVVMITGDHPVTATAIAKKLGIIHNDELQESPAPTVITGRELSQLSAEELKSKVAVLRVYARVSPEQKINIVRALQDNSEFVAMTGDGVNDAPALKQADIGVAMGKIGTDVAREASSMVLLDDNFATIVQAVREGRHIFDNIRKFIKYALATNSGEIWTLFLAPFVGLPVPFLPIHILWINLVTDGLPGLALATEPEDIGIMKRPPRPTQESIFAHGLWQHIIWVGCLMAIVNLAAVAWYSNYSQVHWQTMVFTIMTFMQMGHVLAIRSERESLFKIGLFSNLYLFGAVTITVILQLAVIYLPSLNKIFKTQPLAVSELLICFLLGATLFVAVEFEKFLSRRGFLYSSKL